jgi:cytochrome b561
MFRKPRSLGIRLWHWSDTLTVFALLGTVLLRNTVWSPRDNGNLLFNVFAKEGVPVTQDQAREAGHALVEGLWVWHVNLGYALAALTLARGIVFVMDARKKKTTPAASPAWSLHQKLVKASHAAFYVALVVMVTTGLVLELEHTLPIGWTVVQAMKGVHVRVMWAVIAFIVVHVVGVIRSEHREDPGLVSEMIHGGTQTPTPPGG